MLRIIAGEYRSRRLLTPPDGSATRPWPQRLRESVFNILREWCEGARALDLFAGVGSMGLEAISRGAQVAVMVERDRGVLRLLQRNVEALECGDRAVVVPADALGQAALLRAPRPVDLVFVDPPYASMRDQAGRERVLAQMTRCAELMATPGLLVLRTPLDPARTPHEAEGLIGPEIHRYSHDMWVLLYEPRRAGEAPDEPGRSDDGP